MKRIVIVVSLWLAGCDSAIESSAPRDSAPGDGQAADAEIDRLDPIGRDAKAPLPWLPRVRLDCACADRRTHSTCAQIACLSWPEIEDACDRYCARFGGGAALGCGDACA